MTKCYDKQGFQKLAMSVLRDVHSLIPTTDLEADRDIERLHSLVENRGLGFLTLTLPEAGKRFDRSLADGRLSLLALPGFTPIGGKVSNIIPRFLQGIWLRVFDEQGLLRGEPCIASIAGLRQFFNCFKKARMECDPERITESLSDFYTVDASLRTPTLDWDGVCFNDRTGSDLHLSDESAEYDGFDWSIDHGFCGEQQTDRARRLLEMVQQSLDYLASTLGAFSAEEWKPKHGTGAVSDGRVGKFHKWTFPTWSDRLESVFPMADFGFPNYACWVDWVRGLDDNSGSGFSSDEVPSRMITVPKTMKGPRLIASEPTSNQYCQQAILNFLVRRVQQSPYRHSISFKDQTHNQVLALAASHTGEYATIDLSSASDCVSMWLVERAFRSNPTLLEALMATRTSLLHDSISVPPKVTKLKKFTTMGAATTFPVQTLIYAGIAAGVMSYYNGYPVTPELVKSAMSHIRVFGDDIILRTRYARTYIQVLNFLGFKVNENKTFLDGKFRESCGVDAFDGVDVTPAYILEVYDELRPSTVESVRQCSNNLFEKGMWNTAATLLETLPTRILNMIPVVGHGSGYPGISSFCGTAVPSLKRRWNDDLQRFECRAITVTNRASRQITQGSASLLQYFSEAPNPDDYVKWSSGYDERPRLVVQTRWVAEEEIFNFNFNTN